MRAACALLKYLTARKRINIEKKEHLHPVVGITDTREAKETIDALSLGSRILGINLESLSALHLDSAVNKQISLTSLRHIS